MNCGIISMEKVTGINNFASNSGGFFIARLVKQVIIKNSYFRNNTCLSVGGVLALINE